MKITRRQTKQQRKQGIKIKEIKTELAGEKEVHKTFEIFMEKAKREGANLRMEHTGSLVGQRFVVVFDYDDMG